MRDVVKRYCNANVEINTKSRPCGFCRQDIPAGKPAIFVESFEHKLADTIVLCGKDCSDAHEILEMEFFGCKELEKLPALNPKMKKMRRSDLVFGYHLRLEATMQDALDKSKRFRHSYQLADE